MIQNSKEQHKDILCLISLSDVTRQQMKENGYDPDKAIKELKAIDNVDVGDITMQTISTIFRYKLVIIICHHVRKSNIDVLELSDGTLLPVDSFVNAVVNAVNNRYTGLIDLCICDSENMAKSIKALSQTPDLYRIQYVNENEETGVEYRLFQIYPKLLKFSFDPIEDYHIRYREAFLKANEKAKKDQKKEIEDVSSLPEGTNLGTMSTSAAPETVYRNSPFHVKVFIHADGEEADIIAEIGNYQRKIRRNLKLDDGKRICWDLSFDTDPEAYENLNKHIRGAGSHSEIWNSEKLRIEYTFKCFVKPEFTLNGFNGVLKTTIGDKEPETWSFSFPVEVVPYKEGCFSLDGEKDSILIPDFESMHKFDIIKEELKGKEFDLREIWDIFCKKDRHKIDKDIITQSFFENMVSYGDFRPIYQNAGNRANIKAFINYIRPYFPIDWYNTVIEKLKLIDPELNPDSIQKARPTSKQFREGKKGVLHFPLAFRPK